MRLRNVCNTSGASLTGLAVGLAAGLAAGLLTAPMRGSALRASIRERAVDGSTRLQQLIEEGRRALSTRIHRAQPESLTAPLGEIASMHTGSSTPMGAMS